MESGVETVKKDNMLYAWVKKLCKDDNRVQEVLATLDFVYDKKDGAYHVDVHAYKINSLDYSFCWQQFGGYTDLYDWVFDVACDMEKDKYVVDVGEESYTFWFWKGDYLNLGYGGECGFYYGDGEKDLAVLCATDDEIPMSMYIDYNGDGKTDFNPSQNGEETWWITSFNPNAQDDYMKGKTFSAEDMNITYEIDLTEHMDIYTSWKEEISEEEDDVKEDYKFNDGIVTYTFIGKGNSNQEE